MRRCRECGSWDDAACITDDGPCWWVDVDLCSACAGEPAELDVLT